MIPASPFWDFSLRLYARNGIPDACLALQARHGIDVNLLFYGLWLGLEGTALRRQDIARLAAHVRDLHDGVVKPLRGARTVLRRLVASEDETLRPALGALRVAIKKSELDAEHLEQVMLDALRPAGQPGAPSVALARANGVAYLAFIGARLASEDEANLAVILAALPQAGSAKLDEKSHKPARKRALARPGERRTIS